MNKLLLTSAVCMGVACPAMAVVTSNSDTCNDTNLGTASGTASLEAIWGLNDYECSAGQYFDTTNATCVQCTSNNYCPGGTYNVESQTNGLNSCPNGYGLSVAGASADTDCYRTCTTGDVAHSTAVSGGYYYGDNNRCEPTSCAAGWHVKSGIDFTSRDTSINPVNSAFVGSSGNFRQMAYNGVKRDATYYDMTSSDINTWGGDFENWGTIKGIAKCSAKRGNNHSDQWGGDSSDWTATESELNAAGAGSYCWCNATSFRPTGGDWVALSSPSWVFRIFQSYAWQCAEDCANFCATIVQSNSAFRAAMFGMLGATLASCEANNIVINWYNGATLHDTNQCTYNETITLPTQPNKTGYTFNGWKIKAVPNNNN